MLHREAARLGIECDVALIATPDDTIIRLNVEPYVRYARFSGIENAVLIIIPEYLA
jgi:hypothetical protein